MKLHDATLDGVIRWVRAESARFATTGHDETAYGLDILADMLEDHRDDEVPQEKPR